MYSKKSIGIATGHATPEPRKIALPAAKLLRELAFLDTLIYHHRPVAAARVAYRHQLLRRRVDHVEQFGKYDFLRRHRRQLVNSLDVDHPAFHQACLEGRSEERRVGKEW